MIERTKTRRQRVRELLASLPPDCGVMPADLLEKDSLCEEGVSPRALCCEIVTHDDPEAVQTKNRNRRDSRPC
ncbi:MAG: hypothetical protein GXX96_31030 [Planctomycetaceae bacterium]|nr:hypothetical protein [Planctomycetaceae bacterium]